MNVLCLLGLHGGSDGKASACNAGDPGSIPGWGRSPQEGNGNPLQYSCLKNSMDRGTWWATVHGVIKSRTRLSDFTLTLTMPFYKSNLGIYRFWSLPWIGSTGGLGTNPLPVPMDIEGWIHVANIARKNIIFYHVVYGLPFALLARPTSIRGGHAWDSLWVSF